MRKTILDVPRWKWIVFMLVTVADAMVTILTWGRYTCDWRSNLLFSRWLEPKIGYWVTDDVAAKYDEHWQENGRI